MSVREVGYADVREWSAAASVLAHAFRDNPLNVAVIGDDPKQRLASNLVGMRVQVPVVARHGTLLVARRQDQVVGALLAAGPGEFPFPLAPWASRLRLLFGQGLRVASRWAEVAEALAEEHWVSPHWYLSTVGVTPSLWGTGVGSALLEAFLERVDRDGARAYLETDTSRNLPFYARAGFDVERETRIFDVPIWLLSRAERG